MAITQTVRPLLFLPPNRPRPAADQCPQHNVQLVYDRTEDGWEHYVCPVNRCTSKLVVLLLAD